MSRSSVAFSLLLLAATLGLAPGVPAAAAEQQLRISRSVVAGEGGSYAFGQWTVEAVATLSEGRLAGRGTIEGIISTGESEQRASQPFEFEGRYDPVAGQDDQLAVEFRIPASLRYTVTKAPPLPAGATCKDYICVGQVNEYDFSHVDELTLFSATLTGGRFEATTVSQPAQGQRTTVVTRLELLGAEAEGDIIVAAEHATIPGHRDILNRIEFTVPDVPAADRPEPMIVRVSLGAPGYGGLAETRLGAEAGMVVRTLELANPEPGSPITVFYAWRGDIIPDFTETVQVEVLGTELYGSTTFAVGFGVAVTGFTRLGVDPPRTRQVEPFRITVGRSGGGQPTLEELAGTFDLEFELAIRRLHFQPATSVEQLISELSFNVGDWVEAIAHQGLTLDSAAASSPGVLYGEIGLPWRMAPDGRLWDPTESGDQRHPYYLPFQRGVHMFAAHVSHIVHGIEKLANTTPGPRGYTLHVEMKDVTQAFFDQLVLGCAGEIVQAAADEIADIVELSPSALAGVQIDALGTLWACIKIGLDTELVDQFLAQHILLNTLVMTIVQTEADFEALVEQVRTVAQPVLKGTPGHSLMLVETDSEAVVRSSRDGILQPSPDLGTQVELAAAVPSWEAHRESFSRARIQADGRRFGLQVDADEDLTVTLPDGGRAIVITSEGAAEMMPVVDDRSGDMVFNLPRNIR